VCDISFRSIGTIGIDEATEAVWRSFQDQAKTAEPIIIAGVGATGVETIGGLTFAYPSKRDISLIISGDHVLPEPKREVGKSTERI
jgi:hypothetical protein